jgi:hypothetical protein
MELLIILSVTGVMRKLLKEGICSNTQRVAALAGCHNVILCMV